MKESSDSILAWHFVGDKLRNGDAVPADGEWLEYNGALIMCQAGLHASVDPFDALSYAPGPILCRVECKGTIMHHRDKLVCSRRKILERRDATEGLKYFARMQALSVADLWDCPDVVLNFLMTGRNQAAALDAAWAAARAAALDAAWDAAWAAARAAARAAAWDAAWAAARAAARAAALDAARAAARAAALDAALDAAWNAALDAAWDAAWAAAQAEWNKLVNEAFGVRI